MLKITVTSNVKGVMARARAIAQDQMPFATAKALTLTAKQAQAAVVAEMTRVFDRPTPWALRGTYVKPATKTDLSALLWIKDDAGNGGIPADRFLRPEIESGPRRHKKFEKALIAAGVMPADMYAVPGARVPLDRYGNVTPGTLRAILSGIGAAERTAGYLANRTARSAKRGKKKADYFVGRPGNGKGPLGIWQRVGRGARPILIFVKQPTYRKRLDFYGVAARVAADRFLPTFVETFNAAVASQR